jgi:hypothetical protein
VAGVTHPHTSYTFLFYVDSGTVTPRAIPIAGDLLPMARVWVSRDPTWTEYESLAPPKVTLLQRAKRLMNQFKRGQLIVSALPANDGAADQAVLDGLAGDGADLSKPTELVFYLYLPERIDAENCADSLRDYGFRAVVHRPLGRLGNGTTEERWSVVVRLNNRPEREFIQSVSATMEEQAQKYRGEFDGWEAAITR